MIYVFYFFAAILMWFSIRSFLGGVAYLKYFRRELIKPRSDFTPFATVICPCRGVDEGFEKNVAALFTQDYPEYEIIFVVDDKQDAATESIERVRTASGSDRVSLVRTGSGSNWVPATSKLIIANKAEHSSQKVENLREAVLHADSRSEVLIFVDSDARPAKDWLRSLVAPLENKNVGAATGYRWLISKRPTIGSEMSSAWNASIASALGANTRSNFCWGGSTAIRRDVFERLDIREKWHGTLSDDFTVTHAVKAANLDIVFVPQALTASTNNDNLRETIEFTNRQMKITRVYATPLWALSFFGSTLFNAVMIVALLIVIFSKTNGLQVWVSIIVLLLVTVFSIGKSALRLKAAQLVLTEHEEAMRRQFLTQNTLWLFAPALFLVNCIAALFSRRITWRGTTYELKSRDETVIISPK